MIDTMEDVELPKDEEWYCLRQKGYSDWYRWGSLPNLLLYIDWMESLARGRTKERITATRVSPQQVPYDPLWKMHNFSRWVGRQVESIEP